MKTIITLVLAIICFNASSQNTVKIKFSEDIVIQDLEIEYEFNTYYPVITGKGIKKFDIEKDGCPLHLVVNTKDNKRFNLIIIGSDEDVKPDVIEWMRSDMVVDLSKGEALGCEDVIEAAK